ncbi:MAG: FKBP-type peptidyl-prolyl cis-trans isomerase, partial [Spirochaetota bacterium]
KNDKIQKLSIIRQGAAAKAFEPTWEEFQELSKKVLDERQALMVQEGENTKTILEDFAARQWKGIAFEEDERGLFRYIVKPGSGKTGVERGNVKQYRLHYTLWAPSKEGIATKVDSSVDRGEPIQIAPGQVIEAWNITMPQMQDGEKRVILAPSDLGYGKRGSPPMIQPYSYLLFEMEMLGFVP